MPTPPRRSRTTTGGGAVRASPADAENAAADAVELLDDEPEIVGAIPAPGPEWKELVANVEHFVADVIEGWIVEGRRFASARAKAAAVGALVTGTIEKIRRDPRRWVREHCRR